MGSGMSDAKVIFIRYFAVTISAITTLFALKIFLAFDKNDAATFLAILGWILFMPLFQFGYGRTSYAHVRKMRAEGFNVKNTVTKFANIAFAQALAACILIIVLAYFLSIQNEYSGSRLELVCFAFGLATFQISILKRDLAYSLDLEASYEIIEAFRRLLLLFAYTAIFFDISLYIVSIFSIIVGISTFLYLRLVILSSLNHDQKTVDMDKNSNTLSRKFKVNAMKFWGFTASELAFYNIPLIVFTFYPSASGIAYYAVWSRLWIMLNMPYRIFVDTKINVIITSFLKKNNHAVIKNLLLCVVTSSTIMIASFGFLTYFSNIVFDVLGASNIVDKYLLLSLGIWICGNIIQHTFGSFILSYGEGFNFAFILSFLCLTIILIIFTASYFTFNNVGFSLMLCGIFYLIISFVYLFKSILIIKNNV